MSMIIIINFIKLFLLLWRSYSVMRPLKSYKNEQRLKSRRFSCPFHKMLTQSQTPTIQNQLILENPNTSDSYYSLCNFKERQEALAVEKLRSFDDFSKSKAGLYQKYFGFSSWTRQKSVGENQFEDLKEGDDGISLLFKKLSLEYESFGQKGRSFLSGWQICGGELHQKVQYLKGKSTWKDNSSTRKNEGKAESISSPGSYTPSRKDALQCKPRKGEFPEPKVTKKDRNLQPSPREEIPRQSIRRPTSPHRTIKFHQFSNTNDYIKYYRDNITHTSIREHFYNHVEGKDSKTRPQTIPFVKKMKSHMRRESPAKIYRLHISDKASFGILKVGPCPSLNLKTSPKKSDENEVLFTSKSLIDAETKKGLNKDALMANASRLLSDQSSYSLSAKKSSKARESYPIPTANTTDFDEVQQIRSEDGLTSASDDVKLKKIGLRVNKTLAPRLRSKRKTARFSKPKQNQASVLASKAKQAKNNQRFSTSPGNTLGDKEFLRITKPKVIGVNPASQKASNTKCNSPPNNDQLEASVALYPWVDDDGSIPRGRLIDTNHIINRNLLKSRLPEKGFQACITPSTYPKSTIGLAMEIREDERTVDDTSMQL